MPGITFAIVVAIAVVSIIAYLIGHRHGKASAVATLPAGGIGGSASPTQPQAPIGGDTRIKGV